MSNSKCCEIVTMKHLCIEIYKYSVIKHAIQSDSVSKTYLSLPII